MKIAIFIDKFPVLSQTFVLNQITGLIDLGCDVTILALNKGDIKKSHPDVVEYSLVDKTIYLVDEPSSKLSKCIYRLYFLFKGLTSPSKCKLTIKSLSKGFGHQGKSLLLATIINQEYIKLNFDIILTHFGYNGILANKLRELRVLKGKIATVFHGHEITAYDSIRKYKQDYLTLFKNTEQILPISQLWKSKLLQLGCNEKKIIVHRMGVDLSRFSYLIEGGRNTTDALVRNNLNNDKTIIFTVARFTEKKGIEYSLRAIALLTNTVQIKYIIAGFGELEADLKIITNELNLKDVVEFVGSVDQNQIADYMKTSDIFLQPSITAENGDMEGVPVAIMEAMAFGLPVVSTNHSGIPELIEHGKSGLLSNEKDAESIAEHIKYLIENPNVKNTMRKNARKRVEEVSNVYHLNKDLLTIFKQLLLK